VRHQQPSPDSSPARRSPSTSSTYRPSPRPSSERCTRTHPLAVLTSTASFSFLLVGARAPLHDQHCLARSATRRCPAPLSQGPGDGGEGWARWRRRRSRRSRGARSLQATGGRTRAYGHGRERARGGCHGVRQSLSCLAAYMRSVHKMYAPATSSTFALLSRSRATALTASPDGGSNYWENKRCCYCCRCRWTRALSLSLSLSLNTSLSISL
jgi:hypothetical protein